MNVKHTSNVGIILALFCLLHACSGPDERTDVVSDAAVDVMASDTSRGDSDTDSTGQQSDSGQDVVTDSGQDADSSSDASSKPLEFDAGIWMKPNPCDGQKSFPEDDSEFSIPDRTHTIDPTLTRDELIADMGGMPLQAWSIRADTALKPGNERPYELFANPGTDIPLHVYAVNDYEDLSSFRLNVTVMVDNEPVEASYIRWNSDRTQKLLDVQSTGVNFPVTSDVEIVDITIPGSAFPEERMYEISLAAEVTTTERSSFGESQRYALFNGGYDRPSRPCIEPRLGHRARPIVDQLRSRIGDDIAALFFGGITHRDDVRRVIDVQPGETRRMYLSVLRSDIAVEPTVMVPLLNGEPIGTTKWWVKQGGDRAYDDVPTVDARKSFEVTFPEEPGIYEVQVASWTDPYELFRTPDGEEVEGVSDGGSLLENSNALRFRVVETQSE